MEDQKIEALLNLSLDATSEEREKSLVLSEGYNEEENRWDIIVKYYGDISFLQSDQVDVVELANGYAIITAPEQLLGAISATPQIEYVEKPKRLFFSIAAGKQASCITTVQAGTNGLLGEGVIVAVIDSGIDYSHPDFRNEDGTTRILHIWDQTIPGNPPENYRIGTEYSREQINEALQSNERQEQLAIVPSRDVSGHGTHVSGIAAGNGRASNGRYQGVAPQSDIIAVKIGTPRENSFPRTTELMQALDYAIRKAISYSRPVAVNVSFGNTYGSHSGDTLLETYLEDVANIGRTTICIGTGNEGGASGHTSGRVTMGSNEEVELAVSDYELSVNVQIWKSYVDQFDILVQHPNGRVAGPLQELLGTQRFMLDETELLVYYGEPNPYSTSQEIFIDFIPRYEYIDPGIWKIILAPRRIVGGEYDMWLPSSGILNHGTRFLYPTENTTLTIPSTARQIIAVGAYDAAYKRFAEFSGRGYTRRSSQIKPDLIAPGVGVMSASLGGGYSARSGTSMATPFVTGAAALLMEWGIVRGNDAYLYGEKVSAYLARGASPVPFEQIYPNPRTGFGALCLYDSF